MYLYLNFFVVKYVYFVFIWRERKTENWFEISIFKKKKDLTLISEHKFKNGKLPDQLPELTTSITEHNLNFICIQEQRHCHSKLEIKYHDTGNCQTFASLYAWKNSVNAVIEAFLQLLSPRVLKSLNSIEKIQPKMILASFNGTFFITIISCYSPTNASDEIDIVHNYQSLRSGRIWHKVNFKRSLTGFNSEFSFF